MNPKIAQEMMHFETMFLFVSLMFSAIEQSQKLQTGKSVLKSFVQGSVIPFFVMYCCEIRFKRIKNRAK